MRSDALNKMLRLYALRPSRDRRGQLAEGVALGEGLHQGGRDMKAAKARVRGKSLKSWVAGKLAHQRPKNFNTLAVAMLRGRFQGKG